MVHIETQVSSMLSRSRAGGSAAFQANLAILKEYASSYESTDIPMRAVDDDVNKLTADLTQGQFETTLKKELGKGLLL